MRENEGDHAWRNPYHARHERDESMTLAPRSLNPRVEFSGMQATKQSYGGACTESEAESILGIRGAAEADDIDLSGRGSESIAFLVPALQSLRYLKHLDISQNAISTLKKLRGLPLLESLNCASNAIAILGGFEDCPRLASIDASNNSICALGDLRRLARLKSLQLGGNAFTTCSSLPNNLPSALSTLDLSHNQLPALSDLRYISSLMELRSLDLRANPFASASHLQACPPRPPQRAVDPFAARIAPSFLTPLGLNPRLRACRAPTIARLWCSYSPG